MTKKEVNWRIKNLSGMGTDILDELNKSAEKELEKAYRKAAKEIQSKMSKIYVKHGDDVTYQEMIKFGRLDKLEKEITETLRDAGKEARKITTDVIGDNFERQYYYEGYAIESPFGKDFGFGGLPKNVIKESILNPLDRIGWPNRLQGHISGLNQRVQEGITQGLIQGHGFSKTAKRTADSIGRTVADTERIVWTETQRARTTARNKAFGVSQEAGDRLGVTVKKIWDATLDMRTRIAHRFLDGKAAKVINEILGWMFEDGTFTAGPASSGVAKQDIRCRCNTFTEVDEMTPEFRRDNLEKKEIQYETYENWAKKKKIPYNGEKFKGNIKSFRRG